MPSDDLIEKLAAEALMGTQRGGLPTVDGPATLSEMLQALGARSAEERVLAVAGAVNVYTRAGVLPRLIQSRPAAAPAETLPAVSATSARHLALMLEGKFEEVLPEYLDLVAGAARRVQPRQLPALLSLAAKDAVLRKRVQRVLGERGRWLAQERDDWKALFAAREEADFHTGTMVQRKELLIHLRECDPARARALVASTWNEEKPEDRATFLQTLVSGLSLDDEPFLEAALDDKRREVRDIAADLLARLAGSRLMQRMIERLRPLVTVTKRMLSAPRITIVVPETHSAEMTRDGIAAKSALPKIGDNAYRVAAIVAATPLAFWADATPVLPEDFLTQVEKSEWQEALLWGLGQAAIRQNDHPWSTRILTHLVEVDPELERINLRPLIAPLLQLLTPAEREAVVRPSMKRRDRADSAVLLELLRHCRHTWSLDFSQGFLPLLWRYLTDQKSNYLIIHAVGTVLSLYVHPALAGTVADHVAAESVPPSSHLEQFLSVLQFRFDIHKELTP